MNEESEAIMPQATSPVDAMLHEQLESQFALHVAGLTALTNRPRRTAQDEAAIEAARAAVAETADAIRRIATATTARP
ncbi:hypothetical protein ACFO1B_09750 [Dactylosporangium siamense]|uniref:Uncharacterized protein n=1 Tax=Dactylosporangium siamense TaxID=685454 RepID=A0A919PQT4_9ACTN|nr:hypothetical protein [Dactylosporangium siamense]GIG48976.1 hypothetical protein Dsi01nite_070170 [Dactylosporangium siamense]